MGKGLAIVGLLPLFIACGGKTEHSGELDGPSNDAGDASSISAPPRAVAGSGSGDFPRCAADVDTRPFDRLSRTWPFLGTFVGTTVGTVREVKANAVDVESVAETTHFGWVGPPLTPLFTPNQAVHVGSFPAFGSTAWNTLVSASDPDGPMIAILGGFWDASVSPNVGWSEKLPTPPDFPHFELANLGCCQGEPPENSRSSGLVCDFSALTVSLGDQTTPIAKGATGTIAGWTITNVGASYFDNALNVAIAVLRPSR